jgi:hypothetical protein
LSLQKVYEPKTLPAPTQADKEEAQAIHAKILSIIDSSKVAEAELEHNYISLGKHIYKMQVKTYWLSLGYDSWRDYFSFLQDKFGMGRTQLYGFVGCVKSLSPYVDDDIMVEMGINKAKELKRAIDTTSKAPSEELLEKARDPKVSVAEFRKEVQDEFHIIDHNEKGIWYDLHGIYLLPDEKEEMLKCFDIAKGIDPVIPHTLPAHVQMKEILFRLIEEFMGQHGGLGGDIEGFNQVYNEINEGEVFGT